MARQTEFQLDSGDGKHKLHVLEWLPDRGGTTAVLQIAHGLGDHMGWYEELGKFFTENGFAVVGHSQLGHGETAETGEELGFFTERGGWDTVVGDLYMLYEVMHGRHPDVPYFLFGHSMGSFLARTFLTRYPGRLSGCILSGTGYQPQMLLRTGLTLARLIRRRHGAQYRCAWFHSLCFAGYNRRCERSGTDSDWVTQDPDEVGKLLADVKCTFTPTIGLYCDLLGGVKYIQNKKNFAHMEKDLPVLLISGAEDPAGNYGKGVTKTLLLLKNAGLTDVSMRLYHGCRHKLTSETNRAEVFEDILRWTESKMKSTGKTPAKIKRTAMRRTGKKGSDEKQAGLSLSEIKLEELWRMFPVELEKSDPKYHIWYSEKAHRIISLLGRNAISRINHIGSTAVKGLDAKPVVDILLELSQSGRMEDVQKALTESGWIIMSEDAGSPRAVLCKGYTPGGLEEKVFHLHVRPAGDWDELYFRDYLKAHREAADEYAAHKRRLAVRYRYNRDGYTAAKTGMIETMTTQARSEFGGRYLPEERREKGGSPMASSVEFVEYICARIAGAGRATYRKMFGEYGVYLDGKIIGLICGNAFYLKPTDAAKALLPEVVEAPPYHGAKPYFLIEDLDDAAFLSKLAAATLEELAGQKSKDRAAGGAGNNTSSEESGDLLTMPNIGDKLKKQLSEAGIYTPEGLRQTGSMHAWLRIKAKDQSAGYMHLAALEGAIRGVRWHNLDQETKDELKSFYKSQKKTD